MAATQSILGDAAYSNLYGVRIHGLKTASSTSANFGNVSAPSGTIGSVTANTINGSAASIAFAKVNANQLLATDANIDFVSIPYGLLVIPNSVPTRSAADFTHFNQIFLTASSAQIVANIPGQSTTLDVTTPASNRIYSLQFVSNGTTTNMLAATASATGNNAFADPTIVTAQVGIKASGSGTAQLVLNSAAGTFDDLIHFQITGAPQWAFGTMALSGDFVFRDENLGVNILAIHQVFPSSCQFLVAANLVPTNSSLNLGATTATFNAIGLAQGPGLVTGSVEFSGSIAAQTFDSVVVSCSLCTTTSVVQAAIFNFSSTSYFSVTNGAPYVIVTNVTTGSFTLNVYNMDNTNNMVGITAVVQYWLLP